MKDYFNWSAKKLEHERGLPESPGSVSCLARHTFPHYLLLTLVVEPLHVGVGTGLGSCLSGIEADEGAGKATASFATQIARVHLGQRVEAGAVGGVLKMVIGHIALDAERR